MKISDLFTDPTDNRLSHTKIWNHIGLLCMTIMFCWYSYHFKIDEFHFSNALVNLLYNANKYSTEAPEITVKTRNEGNWYVIEIADKGMGMETDNKVRIFEKFFREETGNITLELCLGSAAALRSTAWLSQPSAKSANNFRLTTGFVILRILSSSS